MATRLLASSSTKDLSHAHCDGVYDIRWQKALGTP